MELCRFRGESVFCQGKEGLLAQLGAQRGGGWGIGDLYSQKVTEQRQARQPIGVNPGQCSLDLGGLLGGGPGTLQAK